MVSKITQDNFIGNSLVISCLSLSLLIFLLPLVSPPVLSLLLFLSYSILVLFLRTPFSLNTKHFHLWIHMCYKTQKDNVKKSVHFFYWTWQPPVVRHIDSVLYDWRVKIWFYIFSFGLRFPINFRFLAIKCLKPMH